MRHLLFCMLALIFILGQPAYSVNINVPGDQPTIQEGINAANPGDTVLVAPGTYTGDLNRDLDFGGKDIVVKSAIGPESAIINPEGTADEPHRAFRFTNGETRNAVVQGFKITGGYGLFEREDRFIGGGIYCEYSSPTIKSCIFEDNIGPTDGGAISGFGAGPSIDRCQFTDNSAIHGGAIFLNGGVEDTVSAEISNSQFMHNSARIEDGYGGALYFMYNGISLTIDNCTFFDNRAHGAGAVKCGESSSFAMTHCTLVSNKAMNTSAIGIGFNSATIANTIIAFNRPSAPVAISYPDELGFNCNDVFGNIGGDYTGHLSDFFEVDGNFSANPHICNVEAGDFHLLDISECLPGNNSCGELVGAFGQGCTYGSNVYKVALDGSGDAETIQAGINLCGYGDTLVVDPGTYSGDGNRDLFFGGKQMEIRSLAGPEQTIIDCQGSESDPHRGFNITCGEDSSLLIDGFTIANGYAAYERNLREGGGIYCELTSPRIQNCIFDSNNGANDGGGIASYAGGPEITSCKFIDNYATHGGAIFCNGQDAPGISVNITDCLFKGNSAHAVNGHGGAIYYQYDDISITIDKCTFFQNSGNIGGALNCGGGSFTNILNSTFAGNDATYGGGIALMTPDVDIQNCIIANNSNYGIYSGYINILNMACTDIYGNTPADLYKLTPNIMENNDNFSLDPEFCDLEGGNLSVVTQSPCAPANNACGILIGSQDAGCMEMIGDVNGDGIINITDAIYLINYIFLGGDAPSPLSIGDANCDGKINIVDAVWIVRYLFAGSNLPGDLDGDGIPDCG